jgi:nucleoside-diphosphate-sugar epimerase
MGDISGSTDWSAVLAGCACVVHLAARVHQLHDDQPRAQTQYQRVNVDATLQLARQAAAARVRRFVFLSSVKVMGECTTGRAPWTESDAELPQDTYGRSKRDAEYGLLQIARDTSMEVVIIRTPLVYGPGVKGNFAALVRAVQHRWPLPLASVKNARSFVGLANLLDFIGVCLVHPSAGNHVFLVSDDRDVSTADMLKLVAQAARCHSNLFPVPPKVLHAVAGLAGRAAAADRLLGNLQVDIAKAKILLNWKPPFSIEENLAPLFELHTA